MHKYIYLCKQRNKRPVLDVKKNTGHIAVSEKTQNYICKAPFMSIL